MSRPPLPACFAGRPHLRQGRNRSQNLAVGFASLNVEVFKSLLETVTALAYALQPVVDGLAGLLGVYGSLLQTPVVEYFASVVGQFKLLETIGVGALSRSHSHQVS